MTTRLATSADQCPECAGIGSHFKGCETGRLPGAAIGYKRPKRTAVELARLAAAEELARVRDARCRRCEARPIEHDRAIIFDYHHRLPVQTGIQNGLTYSELDRPGNLVTLCRKCHNEVHRNGPDGGRFLLTIDQHREQQSATVEP